MSKKLSIPVLAVTAAFAGCGGATAPPADTTAAAPPADTSGGASAQAGADEVSLNEWSVKPASAEVSAGPVELNAVNDGAAPHELVLIKTDTKAADLKVKGGEADETGSVGETGDIAPGASAPLKADLKPGHYALICNIPGHYSQGMYADLDVK